MTCLRHTALFIFLDKDERDFLKEEEFQIPSIA